MLVVIALLVALTTQCWAVAPVNLTMINEAQEYGRQLAHLAVAEFLRPWQVYEERAAKLDERAERACLYTPFLLLATDARQKTLNGQPVRLRDSEQILGNYVGYLVFSVDLFGNSKDFARSVKAWLQQKDARVPVHEVLVPSPSAKTEWWPQKPRYHTRCYLYFYEPNVNLQQPAILVVTTGKQQHRFYFDLPKIK